LGYDAVVVGDLEKLFNGCWRGPLLLLFLGFMLDKLIIFVLRENDNIWRFFFGRFYASRTGKLDLSLANKVIFLFGFLRFYCWLRNRNIKKL